MSGDREYILGQHYFDLFFNDVKNHEQIDPKLVQGIIKCVHASGMRTTDEDVLEHIKGDLVIVFQDNITRDVIAFSSTSIMSPNQYLGRDDVSDENGVYLVGATVAADRQGFGVYTAMNMERVEFGLKQDLKLVFTNTQNPAVVRGVTKTLEKLKEIGRLKDFREGERILRPGLYGRLLTESMPDGPLDGLDYHSGDSYTLLFHLDK